MTYKIVATISPPFKHLFVKLVLRDAADTMEYDEERIPPHADQATIEEAVDELATRNRIPEREIEALKVDAVEQMETYQATLRSSPN